MDRIAVVGDRETILGFRAVGFEVFPAANAEEGREILLSLAKENVAVIYLTEQLAAQLPNEIARYREAVRPAIILIPGKEGSCGIGMANIKTALERAIGADILE